MRVLIIVFLFIGSGVFAQTNQKGTVKVKKLPTNAEKVDTSIMGFDEIIGPAMSSYGQTYDRYPEYVGGDDAMEKFINTTRKYPDCYRCKGNTVGSTLTIMINEDGSITEITIEKGATDCAKCDEEAIRIVKLMPKWKPAQLNGKNIKLKWDIYVRFTYLK